MREIECQRNREREWERERGREAVGAGNACCTLWAALLIRCLWRKITNITLLPTLPPLFQRLLWLHCFPPHQADKGFYVTANFVGTCRRQSNQLTQLQEAPPLPPPSLAPCCFKPALTFVELSNLASHGAACCASKGGAGGK